MVTWSYQQITNPAFLDSLIPEADSLTGKVHLQLHDGEIVVGMRQAFLNLFWWPILTEFNIPISVRHFVKRTALNNTTLTDALNPYYYEIMDQDYKNAKRLKKAIWAFLQKFYMMASTSMLPYVASIDIEDLAAIMEDPAMKEILETKWNITPVMGTDVIEKYIDTQNKRIMKLLGTRGGLSRETLLAYQRVKQLNKFQVPQTIYAFGVRTDVSDNIIGFPVVGSALDGLQNVQEYAVESLSAKKSAFYNHVAVADSQYFGRKQHLLASSVQYIYSRDCESPHLVEFRVTDINYQNLVGKLIYRDKKPLTLTPDNVGSFVGKNTLLFCSLASFVVKPYRPFSHDF